MTELELARVAYEALAQASHGVDVDGRPIPPWDVLDEEAQRRWVAVVLALRAAA